MIYVIKLTRKISTQYEIVELHMKIWIKNPAPQSLLIFHYEVFELESPFPLLLSYSTLSIAHWLGVLGWGTVWKSCKKRWRKIYETILERFAVIKRIEIATSLFP